MQSKISNFFKPKSPDPVCSSEDQLVKFYDDHEDGENEIDLSFYDRKQPEIRVTYARRVPKPDKGEGKSGCEMMDIERVKNPDSASTSELMSSKSSKTLNKKRSYAQFHLELGQSDFLLHSCSLCGLKYAPGNEGDEKLHKTFHRNYTQGIPFKGWSKESLVQMQSLEEGRIILLLDGDPPAQRNKLQEVVKMMETELGEGWIFHKLCKAYLFVSSQRVAGCLIAEPIEAAFQALPCSEDIQSNRRTDEPVKASSNSTILQCGNVKFQREVNKRTPFNTHQILDQKHNGMIVCKTEAVPAVCGIRAIWVTPSNRRKQIASHLLDAVRKSFCMGLVLEKCQLAFSQPTSAGKVLASRYTGTQSFLVYKSTHLGCH